MDAMAYALDPQKKASYQTCRGVILGKTPSANGELLMVCLTTGQRTAVADAQQAWQVGQEVEVLIARAAGSEKGLALRRLPGPKSDEFAVI